MTENLKVFLAKISEDSELAKKFSKLDKDALIVAAKELGFELTEADFAKQEAELSEDEMTTVAGGENQHCACGVVGGGKADPEDGAEPCACVMAGFGDRGRNGIYDCTCSFYGQGVDKD